MKINERLSRVEAKLRLGVKQKPWVMFESHPTDPTLFVGPGGVQLSEGDLDQYQVDNDCRVIQVVLDHAQQDV